MISSNKKFSKLYVFKSYSEITSSVYNDKTTDKSKKDAPLSSYTREYDSKFDYEKKTKREELKENISSTINEAKDYVSEIKSSYQPEKHEKYSISNDIKRDYSYNYKRDDYDKEREKEKEKEKKEENISENAASDRNKSYYKPKENINFKSRYYDEERNYSSDYKFDEKKEEKNSYLNDKNDKKEETYSKRNFKDDELNSKTEERPVKDYSKQSVEFEAKDYYNHTETRGHKDKENLSQFGSKDENHSKISERHKDSPKRHYQPISKTPMNYSSINNLREDNYLNSKYSPLSGPRDDNDRSERDKASANINFDSVNSGGIGLVNKYKYGSSFNNTNSRTPNKYSTGEQPNDINPNSNTNSNFSQFRDNKDKDDSLSMPKSSSALSGFQRNYMNEDKEKNTYSRGHELEEKDKDKVEYNFKKFTPSSTSAYTPAVNQEKPKESDFKKFPSHNTFNNFNNNILESKSNYSHRTKTTGPSSYGADFGVKDYDIKSKLSTIRNQMNLEKKVNTESSELDKNK